MDPNSEHSGKFINMIYRCTCVLVILSLLLSDFLSVDAKSKESQASSLDSLALFQVKRDNSLDSCINSGQPSQLSVDNTLTNGGSAGCFVDFSSYPTVKVQIENKDGYWKEITTPYNLNDVVITPNNIWAKWGFIPPDGVATYTLIFDNKFDSSIQFFVNGARSEDGVARAGRINVTSQILDGLGLILEDVDLGTLSEISSGVLASKHLLLAANALCDHNLTGFLGEFQEALGDDETIDVIEQIAAKLGKTVSRDYLKSVFTIVKIVLTAKSTWETVWSITTKSYAGTVTFTSKVTSNPLPSAPIPSIPQLPGSPPPYATDNAQFTHIESPTDNAIFTPNQTIHKTWRVKNTGTSTWGSGYKLVFTGGELMAAPNEVAVPVTAPGGTAEISIDIAAPADAGDHVGYWQLRNPQGTFFGDKLSVRVNIQTASNYLTLSADPPPPSEANHVTLQAKAQNFPNLRAMRLKIDRNVVYELGAAEFHYDWTTSTYAPGTHSISVEVADQSDVNWSHPQVRTLAYQLTGNAQSLNRSPYKPNLSSPYDWYVYYTGNTAQLCAQANSDPDGDPVTAYYFESIGNWSSGWVTSNCVTTSALVSRTYQWHAKVRDNKGAESEWSDDWHFTLVNPNLSITQLAFEPQDGNSEAVKIRACTAGQGGVGITLRVSINEANDGSSNGAWRITNELGVPCFNDIDAPIWNTLDYADGPHRVRVEAHGSSTGWDGATAREEVYTLPNRRPAWTQLIAPVPFSQKKDEPIYLNTRQVTFRWQPTIRTDNYTLQISTQPNPQQDSAPLFRKTLPAGTTEYTVQFDQAYPTLYWQVTTTNSKGTNASNDQRFGIDQTPPVCNIQTLPNVTYENVFQVAWLATDELSGAKATDIQYFDERGATWQDWLTAVPATKSFDLFNGQPGHTYHFRCRATDQAENQGVYANASSSIQINSDARPVENWWNSAYGQKRSITLLNNVIDKALPVGYPVLLHLDNTTTPSSAALFNASATGIKCNDLRVVYNNTTELSRYIPVCSADQIDIWFRNQIAIDPATTNSTAYRLYYSNANANDPPADQTQIWPPLVDANTVGLWFFSEGTGSALADHSGYGNSGNIGTLTWVGGIFGKALASLNHANGNGAQVPGSPSLGSSAFTLDFFAKRDDLQGGYIAGQGRAGNDNERMRLRVEGPGSLSFQIDPPSPGGASDVRAQSGCLPDLQWHHIAVTFDGVREGRIYCDGVLAGSGSFNATGISNLNFDLFLGSDFSDAGRFQGAIDQVRFSNIVRTSFPHAQFAGITTPPSLAVGDLISAPLVGEADLTVLGVNAYPNPSGGFIVEALVQNQGNQATQNGFYTDLYIDHAPVGANDYTGSVRFWVNSPIMAGAQLTLTTVLTDFTNLGNGAAVQSLAPGSEITHSLSIQADSAGLLKDANKANNILATGAEVCLASADAFEPDDTTQQAGLFPIGQTQAHNFTQPSDQDWIKFTAEAGKIYQLTTNALGATADTYLYLYNTDGVTLLTANDDGADTLASRVDWTAPTNGVYYLLVRNWNPNVDGCGTGYHLSIQQVDVATPTSTATATTVPSDNPTPTPTPTATPTISSGPPATRAIYLPGIFQNSQSIATPVPSQRLAYASNQSGNFEIYQMGSDGKGQINLTNQPSYEWGPNWSPDGKQLAFVSERDGNLEIYVMNADGSSQRRLTHNTVYDAGPTWSPDGQWIAYKSFENNDFHIYLLKPDGSSQKLLTTSANNDWRMSWSPDGGRLAFSSFRDGNGEIYLINADGTGLTRLTNEPTEDNDVAWSPDGKKLAFVSKRAGNPEIYVINQDGSNVIRLTNNPAADTIPVWSPDGQKLVFTSHRDGFDAVYLMNADGSAQTRLTNGPSDSNFAMWKPK